MDTVVETKIIDKILSLTRDYKVENGNKPSYLILNAYTSSELRNELGQDDLYDLKKYKGMEILYTLSIDEEPIRVL